MVKIMKDKTILFIHQNFPGQFKSLAPELAKNKAYKILIHWLQKQIVLRIIQRLHFFNE